MNHSKSLQALVLLLGTPGISLGLEYVWTGKGDVMKLTAPTESVNVSLAKSVKMRSVIFDPGALNAIEIRGESLELVDGGRIEFAKLPGDVGMNKTA